MDVESNKRRFQFRFSISFVLILFVFISLTLVGTIRDWEYEIRLESSDMYYYVLLRGDRIDLIENNGASNRVIADNKTIRNVRDELGQRLFAIDVTWQERLWICLAEFNDSLELKFDEDQRKTNKQGIRGHSTF